MIEQLARVAAIVDDIVQRRVNEGNVKAFEIVLHVERPMRMHCVVVVARRIVPETSYRHPVEARSHVAQERVLVLAGIDSARSHDYRGAANVNARQIVARRGKVLRLLEFRHERHAPGQVETSRVVSTSDLACRAGCSYQDVAAVRAHIGEATQRVLRIAREQKRLVEQARQEVTRRQRFRRGNLIEIADPLPCARENTLTSAPVGGLVAIERGVQRRCDRDVGIDGIGHAGRRSPSVTAAT